MCYVVKIIIQFLLLLYINRHKHVTNLYMPINLFFCLLCLFLLSSFLGKLLVFCCLSRVLAICYPLLCDSYVFLLLVCLLDFWPCICQSLWELWGCLPCVCLIPNPLLLPALWCTVLLDSGLLALLLTHCLPNNISTLLSSWLSQFQIFISSTLCLLTTVHNPNNNI